MQKTLEIKNDEEQIYINKLTEFISLETLNLLLTDEYYDKIYNIYDARKNEDSFKITKMSLERDYEVNIPFELNPVCDYLIDEIKNIISKDLLEKLIIDENYLIYNNLYRFRKL